MTSASDRGRSPPPAPAPAARPARCDRGEDGSVGALLALVVVVVAVVGLLAVLGGGAVALAHGRAADLADAAVVAVVHARLEARADPCGVADDVVLVGPGTAWVADCRLTPEGGARVEVAVAVPSRAVAALGVGEARAVADAVPVWARLDRGRRPHVTGPVEPGRGPRSVRPRTVTSRPVPPEPVVPFELSSLDPRTELSIAAYDTAAPEYQLRLRQHRPTTDIKRFTSGLQRGTLVLDAGCGPANDMRLLRDHGVQPIGLDLSAGALAHARVLLPRDGLVRGAVQEPPFADDSFGGLWCNGGLTHLPRDQWRATFAALLRTVASGPVMLSAYRGTVDLVEVDDDVLGRIHVSAATEDEISGMFEERGLVDVRVEVRPDPLHGRRRPTVYAHGRKQA